MRIDDIIKKELGKIKNRNEKGDSIYICCPFHREKTPSFGINLNPNLIKKGRKIPLGFGHCFSCGEKANWNQIAELTGLQKLTQMRSDGSFKEDYVAPMSDKLKKQLLEEDSGLTLQEIEREWGCVLSYPIEKEDEWRGVKGKLLRKIGCWVSVDSWDNKCLLMPVKVEGEIIGAQKALWEKSKNKKVSSYMNYSGEWIKNKGLFPYDYVDRLINKEEKDYVVLVEGARDALRLLNYGIPTLAILGTNNWSKDKIQLLTLLNIKRVYLLMDADDPGVNARKEIKKEMEKKIETISIKLDKIQRDIVGEFDKKDAWDPGNMPKKYLKKLIRKIDV